VNMDWLLQKIAKDIPKSVQEKILEREKNADIEPKGKKRARESSLGDDQGNSSKKTKDEDQIKLKSMIALVDERYPVPSK
jgi:poly [ADP-ribose] polymerase